MRVLFSTTAGTGHFTPMVPLARACAAAGHEVRVAAPESFASHVARAGLDHAPFDDVDPEVMGAVFAGLSSVSPDLANLTVVRDVFGRLDAQSALPRVRDLVDEWRPDVVLREPCEFGSLAAAERAGVPHAEVAIGMGRMREWVGEQLDEPLGELDEIVGLPAGTCTAAAASARVFTSVPAGLDDAGSAAPAESRAAVVRFRNGSARNRTGSLPATWGDPDQPLVYVSFGSVTAGFAELGTVFRGSLDALAGLPVRVLLTTGQAGEPESLHPWPANAYVAKWWPQEDVMPLAGATVGHGGFGTTMAALAAGVPQVVVPLFAADQEVNAARIEQAGAGVRLGGRTDAVTELAAAVERVLGDDGSRAAAGALADQIDALPDVSEVVPAVERLATQGM